MSGFSPLTPSWCHTPTHPTLPSRWSWEPSSCSLVGALASHPVPSPNYTPCTPQFTYTPITRQMELGVEFLQAHCSLVGALPVTDERREAMLRSQLVVAQCRWWPSTTPYPPPTLSTPQPFDASLAAGRRSEQAWLSPSVALLHPPLLSSALLHSHTCNLPPRSTHPLTPHTLYL